MNRSEASSDREIAPGRIVVALLGGSSAFTPALGRALADAAVSLPRLEIRLHGRNRDRLDAVARFCNRQAQTLGAPHHYDPAGSVSEAADNALVIINQMRIGGWPGRSNDERFPLSFGLPGDETIGPGGLASAIRSVPVVLEAAREAAKTAPGAWFINLTNPMGILLAALRRVPDLRHLGLCELPGRVLERAASLVGLTPPQLEADYLGLNHQGWFVRLALDGRNLLPEIIKRAAPPEEAFFWRVDPEVMRRIKALPLPYMRLYYHTAREVEALQQQRQSRGAQLNQLSNRLHQLYRETSEGQLPDLIRQRDLVWYELALVPALSALLGGDERRLYISEINGNDLPGLPPGAIVEKQVLLGQNGARMIPFTGPEPAAGGPLAPFLEFLEKVVRFESAALRAALDPRLEMVVEALRLHPLGIDQETAQVMAPKVLQPVEK